MDLAVTMVTLHLSARQSGGLLQAVVQPLCPQLSVLSRPPAGRLKLSIEDDCDRAARSAALEKVKNPRTSSQVSQRSKTASRLRFGAECDLHPDVAERVCARVRDRGGPGITANVPAEVWASDLRGTRTVG